MIKGLSELERRILANLNEAGEENASALLNSTLRCSGEEMEVTRYLAALRGLYSHGLIEFATSRDGSTLKWNVLARDHETAKIIDELYAQMTWESGSQIWRWNCDKPRLVILLTEIGIEESHDILDIFGWRMTEPM